MADGLRLAPELEAVVVPSEDALTAYIEAEAANCRCETVCNCDESEWTWPSS